MEQFRYCPMCATLLSRAQVEDTERSVCVRCNWINYLNPRPVVCAIPVAADGRVALVKRGVEPAKGTWALPGGFMELNEEPAAACARELLEETGLEAAELVLIDALHQKSGRYGSVVVIGYEAKIVDTAGAAPGDDAQDVCWADQANMPEMPFVSYQKIVEIWRRRQSF